MSKFTPQPTQTELPYPKLCECGCEQPAPIATKTNRLCGHIKGEPMRFVYGHHQKMRPQKSLSVEFWKRVTQGTPSECWLWQGSTNYAGYGNLKFHARSILAHRISYELHNGQIPNRKCVLHRCDRPACVNPNHLFIGTRPDNVQDMIQKGRARKATGTKSARAKLTESDAQEIRKLASEKVGSTQIGRKYGISRSQVRRIVRRQFWKHIP